MICPACRHDNAAGMKFCGECGARLAMACPACGAASPAGQKFCGECGKPLAAAADVPPARTPESYTPGHLAERILTSRSALEGERKQVTVLFADLKGSMELLAERDPEQARRILDPVLEHMMEAVHRYEGTVNQVMGDGIMALFGAPLAHEDHAVRACYAALRMREAITRYADGIFRSYGVPLETRIGLNSGEVVVRSIGSDLRMDYSAVGQTTHLAARMEQMARPGTILITPDTLALAEGYVHVTPRGSVPVKGLASPIELFELDGASPVRSRLQATASRGLTPFIGRETELDLLRQALDQAGAARGQVVAVVGEPGVGKSRLAWEFTHSHRSRDWLALETASVSYGKATSYFPVVELLRSYFGIGAGDDKRRMREKVVGKLLALDRALEPTLPVFLSLLDVPVDDPDWARLDPAQRRRQTLEALRGLLLRESQTQPVLLVVEDLHWIDSETQAWLDLLVESLPAARLLLLVNYRPEYTHAWGRKTYYHQLRLDALPTTSAAMLLEALLGNEPGLADLKRSLIDRTQGNPFFLEECVRTLTETGLLSGERGALRLERPLEGLQVPATVQTVLAARIDRLPPNDKALLQTAAVIGKDFSLALLEAIAPLAGSGLEEGLDRLQAAEFLYQAALFPEREYTFKHALTHEVAYRSLLKSVREGHHGRIAEALVGRFSDTVERQPELAAHHYAEAGALSRAVIYRQKAGERALERSANVDAIRYLTQALDGIQALAPQDRAACELDLQISLALASHAIKGQTAPEVGRAYERARELCEQVHSPAKLFRVLLGLYRFYGGTGRYVLGLEIVEQLVEMAERSKDPEQLLEAHMARGTWLLDTDPATARGHLETAVAMYAATPTTRPLLDPGVVSLSRLSWALWYLGFPDQASRRSQEALALARRLGQPYTLAMALAFAAMFRQYRRELEAVRELADATRSFSMEHGVRQWAPTGAFLLGWGKVVRGDHQAGLAEMLRAYADYQALGLSMNRRWWLDLLAEAYGAVGQPAAGLALLPEDLDSRPTLPDVDLLRRKRLLLLALQRDQAEMVRADACLAIGVSLAADKQAKSLELRVSVSRSRLLQELGRREDARTALAPIYGWFTEGFDTPELIEARAVLDSLA
jgi:class 3 adenylate cyclase